MRILLPFIISVDEVLRTRQLLAEAATGLGIDVDSVPVGIMVETPAAVESLDLLAPHIEFISLGTNDLTQYSLAVDRGNARLAHLGDPMHPAMVRLYARVFDVATEAGLDVSVCGNLATDSTGLALLVGLGYRDFSVSPAVIPEIRELAAALSSTILAELVDGLERPERLTTVRDRLHRYLEETVPDEATRLGR
jgi:phosphoenolpyruvate-protein kinase (PTS system EI component)